METMESTEQMNEAQKKYEKRLNGHQSYLKSEKEWCVNQHNSLMQTRSFCESVMGDMVKILAKGECTFSLITGYISITVENREIAKEIRAYLATLYPKPDERLWKKEVSGECLTYANTMFDGNFSIKITVGELPASCKVVEVKEVVAAVPEHTRIVKKIVCNDREIED